MSLSYDDLTQRLLSLDLIDMDALREVERSFGAKVFTAEEFLQALQRHGRLTKYQVERLLNGETTGYYYGDYRIQYLVGAGSFARVFRCVHKDTGQVVAVKVLRARYRDDQTAVNEFKREGELCMQMHHPNIAAVYELHHTKYEHFIVMEFVEGRTLREELNAQKNGRLEPRRATRIARDVCSALEYALKRGYQHRDMKLTNVMLSSSGKAVLLDFGLLADEASNFKTQRAIEYAALERATHVPRDDKRSDLYFLGAVYYQLLTGIAPLGEVKERSRRLDASRFRLVKPIWQVAPDVPRCVATVVERAMKIAPEERYQTPKDMLEALDSAIEALEAGGDGAAATITTKPKKKAPTASVLVVEANPDLQNAFRQSLKNAGFRAMVVSNAERALERLDDPDGAAIDLALFNAQSLGQSAVIAFNRMLDSSYTRDMPAILLLDENQVQWAPKAKRSKKRLAVGMPIAMKRLLMVVDKLIKTEMKPVAEPEKPTSPAPAPGGSAAPATPVAPAAPVEPIKSVVTPLNFPSSPVEPPAPVAQTTQSELALDDCPEDAFDMALDNAVDHMRVNNDPTVVPPAPAPTPAPPAVEPQFQPLAFDNPDDDSYIDDED
ncbi:MAG: protein kinase [Planctomycetia bacterium]|nr:protein kinase [Planctomycetia bacterium]